MLINFTFQLCIKRKEKWWTEGDSNSRPLPLWIDAKCVKSAKEAI